MRRPLLLTLLFVAVAGALPQRRRRPAAAQFNPAVEPQNYSITQQRQTVYDTPQYQTQLSAISLNDLTGRSRPRPPIPAGSSSPTCAGTEATAAPATSGSTTGRPTATASSRPVLFTARNGATLSGHVWATVAGPAKRPGS